MNSIRALLFASLLALANSAFAQQFSGQVLTIIVNYPAGGPADIDARVIGKHLPKYLQGVNSIIVRNVGGAGGRIGVNQLGEASIKDRLMLGFFTWNPIDQIIGEETLRVHYNDLKFIAGFQQPTVVYARRDMPPGISKAADLAKAQLF